LQRRLMLRGVLGAAALVLSPALAPAVPSVLLHTTLTTALGGVFAPVPVLALVSQVVFQMKVIFLRWVAAGAVGAAALVVWAGSSFTPTTMAAPIPASVVAKPKPVMDRVKMLSIEMMIESEEIRKEIGLADSDFKVIKESAVAKREADQKKLQAQIQQQIPVQIPGGPAGAMRVNFASINEESAKEARALQESIIKDVSEKIKPDGLLRLKQLYLQQQGPRLLMDRLLIRELQLSAEQEDKLDETLKAKHVGFIPKANTEKMAEEVDEEWKVARKMLSAEQAKKLDELLGKSFSTVALLQASPNHEANLSKSVQLFNVRMGAPAFAPAAPPPPPPVEKP
jgi:hypothetical protein